MKEIYQFLGVLIMVVVLGTALGYIGVNPLTWATFLIFAVGMIVFSFVYKDSQ